MHYRIFSILTAFICLFGCVLTSAAQDANGTSPYTPERALIIGRLFINI